MNLEMIGRADREVADSMLRELKRQQGNIELIASENFVSETVMNAVLCMRIIKHESIVRIFQNQKEINAQTRRTSNRNLMK